MVKQRSQALSRILIASLGIGLFLGFGSQVLSQAAVKLKLDRLLSSFYSQDLAFQEMDEREVQAILQDRLPRTYRSGSLKLARHLLRLSRRYDVDPALVLAVIDQESDFNPRARSERGAMGLMQLMPRTARWIGQVVAFAPVEDQHLLDPYTNLVFGIHYLAHLKEVYPDLNGPWILAAYNVGPERLRFLRAQSPDYQPSKMLQRYVDEIQKNVNNFRSHRVTRI